MNKQKGFSLVEGLLIVLILCFVSFAGWFVWDRSADDKELVSEKPEAVQQKDELIATSDKNEISWVSFNAPAHGFSFKYPSNWGEAKESLTGDYTGDCSISCGKTLEISFSNPDAAIEVKGRTIDFHVGRGSSDLNLAQKGYKITDASTIEVYGYAGITKRGDIPDKEVINGEVKTNINGLEYVVQVANLTDNPFIEQKYDVSNVHSALFNLPKNESGISGIAVSLGVTSDNKEIFNMWIDTFEFN